MSASDLENAIIASIEGVRSRRSTGETLLTLAVPAEHSAKISSFLTRVGEYVGVAFAEIEKPDSSPDGQAGSAAVAGEESPQPGGRRAHGLAEHLHLVGYFRNIKLWEALEKNNVYTQAEHKTWIEQQPCHFAEAGNCNGDICAHHTPSAALPAAGKGSNPRKPPHWFTIPACHAHHNFVHGKDCSRQQKEQNVLAAVGLMAGQAKHFVKAYIGLDSLADITLLTLHEFEQAMDLPLYAGWEAP